MHSTLKTTFKIGFALFLSVLVSSSPLTPAYAYATTEETPTVETVTPVENTQEQQAETSEVVEETIDAPVAPKEEAPMNEGQSAQRSNFVYQPPACEKNDIYVISKNSKLTEAKVSLTFSALLKGKSCTVSLNSYGTQGPTWQTSGTQTFIEHDQETLSLHNPTGTLKVKLAKCYGQNDLYLGATRYDGTDGPLPHYPSPAVPENLIAHWNGGNACEVKPCVTTTGPEMVTKASDFADYQDTRANGHYEFTPTGLRIYTDGASDTGPRTDGGSGTWNTDKVAWYNNVTPYSLADVGEPSMEYTGTSPAPGLQLVIDFDNDGTPDSTLVGETIYGNDWWAPDSAKQFVKDGAPSHTGGSGSANHGTLSQWLTAFPDAKVQTVGFSLGSGVHGDGKIKSLTFGCHKWVFEREEVPVTTCPAVLNTNHSTNLNNNGWTLPADAEYVSGGIKLGVSGAWDETYIERSFAGPLADIGNQVDFTANPNQYAGIHIVTSKGVLVYEKEASYGGKWWSTSDFGVASGMGYATFDTLANIVAANPDVTTSLLRALYTSPDVSSSTISTVTVGCTIYTFDKVAGGQGGGTPGDTTTPGQTLGTSTTTTVPAATTAALPETLPETGIETNPLMIILAALTAYGAAYFLQGRRQVTNKLDV